MSDGGGIILVTGATGNVGREVVRALTAKGMRARAADRDPERARALFGSEVESVRFDYRDPSTFVAADGASGLFLLRPPAIADVAKTLLPFVDEAFRRGIRHVVFLSVAGAEKNPLVPHHAVEAHLAKKGRYTILRPGFFAQNLGDAYRRDIVEDARIYVPAGRGRAAFVDVRDVADVAVSIFREPRRHDEKAYNLTGHEALDFVSVASILSGHLRRPIRYQPASLIGYAMHLRRRNMPWAQVAVQTTLHVGLRLGQARRVDPTLEHLLGRSSRTVGDYVRDHVATWSPRGEW